MRKDDFRLYDPLGLDLEKPEKPETVSPDLMMRIIIALLFVCSLVAVLVQQRQSAMLENERLKQTIFQQQRVLDSVSTQMAEELKKLMRESAPVAPVEVEKPKAPEKSQPVKRHRPKATGQNQLVTDGYGNRGNG